MLFKDPKKAANKMYKVLETYSGKDLEGLEYEPLFDYFRSTFDGVGYKVLNDTYVTDEDGTGIVHQAPAFGEDDYRVSKKYGLITDDRAPPCPVDERGIYTSEVKDYVGQYVKVRELSSFLTQGCRQTYPKRYKTQRSTHCSVPTYSLVSVLLAVKLDRYKKKLIS